MEKMLLTTAIFAIVLIFKCHCTEKHFEGEEHNPEYDHEAVLGGSHDESQEFKKLDPADAKAKLGDIIDRMDTNKNGVISHEELTNWITNSFTALNNVEVETTMKGQDENNDTLVTWKEYVRAIYGYDPEEIDNADNQNDENIASLIDLVDQDKLKFESADENSDGQLNIDEYAAFHHPNLHPQMKDYELDRTLMHYDKNKDGKIDVNEFVTDSTDPESEKQTFDTYDTNKDGMLSREELEVWVIPNAKETVASEVDHLFEESDVDKDRELTSQEILNQYELWVGSAATDYGQSFYEHDAGEL